jgi:2-phospho-L-lactate guanylyltransferase
LNSRVPEISAADGAGRAPEGTRGPWWVVVPVKSGARAKSRLAVDRVLRARLARAFTADTVSALLGSARVAGVVAVLGLVEDPGDGAALRARGVRIVEEPPSTAGDLNAALRAGIAAVHADHVDAPVALVLGDLPALRPQSVDNALDIALKAAGSVFVADASGQGTTLLARAGRAPQPLFGAGSAAAHRADGAIEISALVPDDLRCDVDTADDLDAVLNLGVGPATRAALADRLSPEDPTEQPGM